MRFTIEHALLRCNHASGESGQEAEERTSRVCAQLSRREEERRAHTHRVDIATEQGRFFDWLPNPVKPTAERQLCGCLDHSFSEALRGRSTVLQQRMPRILHRTCFVTIFLAKGKYISFYPIHAFPRFHVESVFLSPDDSCDLNILLWVV